MHTAIKTTPRIEPRDAPMIVLLSVLFGGGESAFVTASGAELVTVGLLVTEKLSPVDAAVAVDLIGNGSVPMGTRLLCP